MTDDYDADSDPAGENSGVSRRGLMAGGLGALGLGAAAAGTAGASNHLPEKGIFELGDVIAFYDDGGDIVLEHTPSGNLIRYDSDAGEWSFTPSVTNLIDSGEDSPAGGDRYQLPQASDSIDLQGQGEIEDAAAITTEEALIGEDTRYDLVSNQRQTISVPGDYSTIQAAVDAVPKRLRHQWVIEISDGTYNEDVLIRGHSVEGFTDSSSGDVYTNDGENNLFILVGNESAPSNVTVNSVTAVGNVSAAAPSIRSVEITGTSPYVDESTQVAFNGGGQPKARNCVFAPASAVDSAVQYYGANGKVEENEFVNNIRDGVAIKRGGFVTVLNNSGSLGSNLVAITQTGVAVIASNSVDARFRPNADQQGIIFDYDTGAVYGSGVDLGAYATSEGFRHEELFISGLQIDTSGSGSAQYDGNAGTRKLITGTTSGSHAFARRNLRGNGIANLSWDKSWDVSFTIENRDATGPLYWVLGAIGEDIYTTKHVGIAFDSGDFIATAGDGSTQSTSTITTGAASQIRTLRLDYIPDERVRVTDNQGTELATVDTNLPSGAFSFDSLATCLVENSTATDRQLWLGEARFEMLTTGG